MGEKTFYPATGKTRNRKFNETGVRVLNPLLNSAAAVAWDVDVSKVGAWLITAH
jgi:hypothetical protein